MNILITGGTGFIGSYLIKHIEARGDSAMILTRNPNKYKDTDTCTYHKVDDDLTELVEKADAIINMAGENLFDQRWTQSAKERIKSSRIDITKSLVDAVAKAEQKPDVMVSSSGVNYYGGQGEKEIDETHPPADDFLARLCVEWEQTASEVTQFGVRVAISRTGVTLEKDGGALAKMITPFKLFAGGPLGDGSQYFPWIHMEDLCRSFLFAIDTPEMEGAFNNVAPNPVTMKMFAQELGKVMGRPSLFRVPEIALKTLLGEASLPVLASLNVKPAKLLKAGFTFNYPYVDQALKAVFEK